MVGAGLVGAAVGAMVGGFAVGDEGAAAVHPLVEAPIMGLKSNKSTPVASSAKSEGVSAHV